MQTTDVDHPGPDDHVGCWVVQTASGSAYLLDLDSAQVTRLRAAEEPLPDVAVAALRRDGGAVPLLAIGPVLVGLPLVMVLQVRVDAVHTVRQTTPVVAIRRLPPGDAPPAEAGRHEPTSSSELPDGADGLGTGGQ